MSSRSPAARASGREPMKQGERVIMRFRRSRMAERRKIEESGLFDVDLYRSQFPETAPSGDLLEHYLENGARLGYAPSRDFDGAWYLQTNLDVAAAGVNPLLHYIIW